MVYQRRVKIVCTLGPSSQTPQMIKELFLAGMNVARLNFSHGDYDFHRDLVKNIRDIAAELHKPVAILQDLQGPKIRAQKMTDGGVLLVEGNTTIITTEEILGTAERFSTSYKNLPYDVSPGESILLDDGNLALDVLEIKGTDIYCRVRNGGVLKDKKGINLPHTKVSSPSLTDKDLQDARFGAELGVDAVALSFVRSRHDVRTLRRELALVNSRPYIIAKLEKPEAIEQLDGIMEESDGVMVARGDLGVEMPTEKVPTLQKHIVTEANRRGKLVIVATQMLESMITNPRPTRAEASDVANAVLDGADAVMLSAETASGKHPALVVETMSRIVAEAEQSPQALHRLIPHSLIGMDTQNFQNAIAQSAVRAADELDAAAIIIYTTSGNTARLVSDYRPKKPILALVPNVNEQRRLAFAWGVESHILPSAQSTDDFFQQLDHWIIQHRIAHIGETMVVVTKQPLLSSQRTNSLHLHTVGASAR